MEIKGKYNILPVMNRAGGREVQGSCRAGKVEKRGLG